MAAKGDEALGRTTVEVFDPDGERAPAPGRPGRSTRGPGGSRRLVIGASIVAIAAGGAALLWWLPGRGGDRPTASRTAPVASTATSATQPAAEIGLTPLEVLPAPLKPVAQSGGDAAVEVVRKIPDRASDIEIGGLKELFSLLQLAVRRASPAALQKVTVGSLQPARGRPLERGVLAVGRATADPGVAAFEAARVGAELATLIAPRRLAAMDGVAVRAASAPEFTVGAAAIAAEASPAMGRATLNAARGLVGGDAALPDGTRVTAVHVRGDSSAPATYVTLSGPGAGLATGAAVDALMGDFPATAWWIVQAEDAAGTTVRSTWRGPGVGGGWIASPAETPRERVNAMALGLIVTGGEAVADARVDVDDGNLTIAVPSAWTSPSWEQAIGTALAMQVAVRAGTVGIRPPTGYREVDLDGNATVGLLALPRAARPSGPADVTAAERAIRALVEPLGLRMAFAPSAWLVTGRISPPLDETRRRSIEAAIWAALDAIDAAAPVLISWENDQGWQQDGAWRLGAT